MPRRADQREIRRAYLDKARRWHPDRFSAKPAAEAERAEHEMRQVNEAWERIERNDVKYRFVIDLASLG